MTAPAHTIPRNAVLALSLAAFASGISLRLTDALLEQIIDARLRSIVKKS